MKLWIDDEREAPAGYVWAKTAQDAIDCFCSRTVTEASFDHDYGQCLMCQPPPTLMGFPNEVLSVIENIRALVTNGVPCRHDGTYVINWLEETVHTDPSFPVPRLEVHSQNPVGIQRLRTAFASIERHVRTREGK